VRLRPENSFLLQFKDELNEQNKTIIVAIHHPILSANKRGFARMGGFSNQAYFNNQMQYNLGRLETIANQFEDAVFVSGNHKNLQFSNG
jgi:hypothetical protein